MDINPHHPLGDFAFSQFAWFRCDRVIRTTGRNLNGFQLLAFPSPGPLSAAREPYSTGERLLEQDQPIVAWCSGQLRPALGDLVFEVEQVFWSRGAGLELVI